MKYRLSNLKLVITVIAALAVLLSVVLLALARHADAQRLQDAESGLRTLMLTMDESLHYLAQKQDLNAIRKRIALLGADARIQTALFTDHDLRVLASSDRGQQGLLLGEALGEERAKFIAHSLAELKMPLTIRVWTSRQKRVVYGIALIKQREGMASTAENPGFGMFFVSMAADIGDPPLFANAFDESFLSVLFTLLLLLGVAVILYLSYLRKLQKMDAVITFSQQKHSHLGDVFHGKDRLSHLGARVVNLVNQVNEQQQIIELKENDLKKILDSIADGVIAVDLAGRISRINRVATELTGWTNSEAKGLRLNEVFNLFSETSGLPLDLTLQEHLLASSDATVEGCQLAAKTGQRVSIAYSVLPMREANSELNGAVVVFQNISEAQETQRLLDEIAGSVSTDPSTTFLENLAHNLHRMFSVRYVLIGVIDTQDPGQVNTLVVYSNGQFAENFSYRLAGTPCEGVAESEVRYYPEKVQQLFPDSTWLAEHQVESYMGASVRSSRGEVIGMISLMNDKPMESLRYFEETLNIFASRVAAEIERTAAYQELEQTQERLLQHLAATPVGVIEWDHNFRVIDWNTSAERIFGYSKEEATGKSLELIVPEEVRANIAEIWQSLLSGVGGDHSRNENIDKQGNRLFCDWYNTPIYNDQGKFVGVASLILDISGERKALRELVKKEIEQREILDSMVDAVITINHQGTVLTFNSAAEQMFGYGADEIIGGNVSRLMTGTDRDHHDSYIANFLETGKAKIMGSGREVLGQRKDGSCFPFRLAISELPPGSDGQLRFIGCCQDLTLQKQQEEQIRRTQRMESLGKLTSGVAHDFNNILGIAGGYANLLDSFLSGEEKLHKYVQEIGKACDRGARLTKRMLAFSRDAYQQLQTVNINRLLEDERDLLEKTLTPSVTLDIQSNPVLWSVELDVSDFMDAVINLVINATHAMQGSGLVTISMSNRTVFRDQATLLHLAAGDYVVVTITDNGEGIPEDIRNKVFDPFFTTKRERGSGLGLSQVYGFMKRSQGAIDLQSVVGEGTSFALYFPRSGAEQLDVVAVAEEQRASLVSQGETILVVDDEQAIRDMVSDLLTAEGYQVLTADDAQQALTLLETHQVDLLFSDVIMPGMNGLDLAKTVAEKYPQLPVQLATGFSDSGPLDDREKYLQYEIIRKPYKLELLLRRIRHILDAQGE